MGRASATPTPNAVAPQMSPQQAMMQTQAARFPQPQGGVPQMAPTPQPPQAMRIPQPAPQMPAVPYRTMMANAVRGQAPGVMQ